MNFYSDGDNLGGFEISKFPTDRNLARKRKGFGLGIAPVVAAVASDPKVQQAATKYNAITASINAVKSIFSKKTKTHNPGSQRKYGGYMQEWQEGGWWYIPQWERELYSRQIVSRLAELGYAASQAEVNNFFFYKYDEKIEGRKPGFTGPQIQWGPGPIAATVNAIAADFVKTLPKGSTLSEAEAELQAAEKQAQALADMQARMDEEVKKRVALEKEQQAALAAAQQKAGSDAAAAAEAAKKAALEASKKAAEEALKGEGEQAANQAADANPFAAIGKDLGPKMAGMLSGANIGKVAMIAVPLIMVGMLFGHTSRPAPLANPRRRR